KQQRKFLAVLSANLQLTTGIALLKNTFKIIFYDTFAALRRKVVDIGRQRLFDRKAKHFSAVFINGKYVAIGIVDAHQALRVFEKAAEAFLALLHQAVLLIDLGNIVTDGVKHPGVSFQLYG